MAALRALDALTDRCELVESTGQGRNRVWQHRGILNVLDAYAAEIRRMSVRSAKRSARSSRVQFRSLIVVSCVSKEPIMHIMSVRLTSAWFR